jgi:hypothetical protein
VTGGQDQTRVYLHVGKTGGTSFLDKARAIVTVEPERVPILLPHEWTVPRIRAALPEARISLVIRDPLERVVSGFISRERAGRPTYNSPWASEEAIAFLYFKDVREYLRALLSENQRDAAAADFASRSIAHIRRGYRYHVPDITEINSWAGPIGHFEDIQAFTSNMLGNGITIGHMHANPISAKTILDEFLFEERIQLRSHFAAEYEVYDALKALML